MSTGSHDSSAESTNEKALTSLEPPVNPTVVIPDGGLQAWATVAGSFLIMFCGFGYSSSFGVYQDFYVRTYLLESSPSAISWIGSVNIFIVLSGGLIAGRLHDRGYFYWLMYGGSFVMALSLFLLSLARPNRFYEVFLAQGIANGIGAGMTYVPCMAVISHHFQKRRALAMAIVASGSSLGAVIHPIMLNNTLHSRLGFGNAVRASAGLISGLLLIGCCFMRTRLPPPKQALPLGPTIRKFTRDQAYTAATTGLAIFTIGFYYPLFYLQLDATQHGLDPTFAFYALVVMNASSFVGRLCPGLVSHRWGVKQMITVAAGCGAVLILAMTGIHSIASVFTIGVLYGFFAGNIVALIGPLLAVLTDDISELGARMGISFAFSGIGILVGPPIDGLLLTTDFIWWRPALFSGVMTLVGFGFFLLMLILHRRKM
ncbi:major facilitator superfamily domain-containing protein [Mycena maculata]|uniref:Major facilitator superfamily domain-containing protein n=1 Tax=Mycena maculata TaxID=230809 RepID=A0AAD7JEI0_9AGAR|nr:major facilitator superfamily domain-containing protein [Mycena maculata]